MAYAYNPPRASQGLYNTAQKQKHGSQSLPALAPKTPSVSFPHSCPHCPHSGHCVWTRSHFLCQAASYASLSPQLKHFSPQEDVSHQIQCLTHSLLLCFHLCSGALGEQEPGLSCSHLSPRGAWPIGGIWQGSLE